MDPIELHEAVVGTGLYYCQSISKSSATLTYFYYTGGLCGGIFIDEAFETMCKSRLGRKWNKLTQNGVKDIMKNEWEYAIKPQFKLENTLTEEYIVAIPAEAFESSDLNDESRRPIIKNGRIHFSR